MASYLDVVAGDDVTDGPERGRDDGLVVVHHQLHEAPADSGIDHGLGRGENRRVKNIRAARLLDAQQGFYMKQKCEVLGFMFNVIRC